MPRRKRPQETRRSEHWMRIAANQDADAFNQIVIKNFGWRSNELITWLSPVQSDDYAEYFDESFLDRLGVRNLCIPLNDFWPRSGPRWDALARTNLGKFILVEAKAYIEEGVDYRSKAGPNSLSKIESALEEAKIDFGANKEAPWETPFYQYANRLAHLYFLHRLNGLDAYLIFLYFANAPDVPNPCTVEEWQGATRLVEKCLGLGSHSYRDRVKTIIWSVPEMPFNQSMKTD